MSYITIHGPDGDFDAYLSAPAQRRGPGLVLLQYICGVNQVMRDIADGFAAHGYVVVVPDLYWRHGRRISLIDQPAQPAAAEQARALELNQLFDDAQATNDLKATLATVRRLECCDGRAGALGYCLGGRLAYLMAARTNVDCSVGYYPVNLQSYLGEAANIRAPLMLHVAEMDVLVPPDVRHEVCTGLSEVPGVDIRVYPSVNHAFALVGGPNYHAETAAKANEASERFLARHLPVDPQREVRS
jgi:carboxymethylenebutenolidase